MPCVTLSLESSERARRKLMDAKAPAPDFGITLDSAAVKRRSVHGAVITFIAQALKFVIQFGSLVAVSRLLQPSDFGLIALVSPVIGFVRIFNDLGFGQAIIQRSAITQGQVSALFWINILISLGLTAIMAAVAPLLGLLYHDDKIVLITLALSSLIMVATFSIVPAAVLNRQMRFVPLAIIDVGSLAVGAMAGIGSAYSGFGYWALVIMQAANALTSLALNWCFAGWRPSRPSREPGIRSLLGFGANITGSNLATYFAMSADNMIVGLANGQTALGLYDRSYNLVVQPLMQIMAPISRVAVPLLSRLEKTPERFERAFFQMLQFALLACSPELIFNVVDPERLVQFLLGAKWLAISPIFAWICLGGLASTINASAGWIFVSQNRTREQVVFFSVNAAISVASFAVGAFWGVVGVAAVSAISFSLIQTPLLIWAATRAGAVTLPAFLRIVAPFVVAGGATALMLIYARLDGDGLVPLVVSLVEAYFAFSSTLLLFPSGRRLFRDAVAMRSILMQAA